MKFFKLCLFIIITLIINNSYSQSVYYVDKETGNDADDGITHETAYATIKYALTQMDGGDILYVYKGEYTPSNDSLDITTSLNGTASQYTKIIAMEDSVIITQTSSTWSLTRDYWIKWEAKYILFDGFEIRHKHSATSKTNIAIIGTNAGDYCKFRNLFFGRYNGTAQRTTPALSTQLKTQGETVTGIEISGCVFDSVGRGPYFYGQHIVDLTIENCTIYGCTYEGIRIDCRDDGASSSNITVINNLVVNNNDGYKINWDQASNTVFKYNCAYNNTSSNFTQDVTDDNYNWVENPEFLSAATDFFYIGHDTKCCDHGKDGIFVGARPAILMIMGRGK